MQFVCMCALGEYAWVCADTCTVLFMEICVQEDMELQVREEPVLVCAVERREVQGVQKGNRVVVLVYGIE